MIFVEISFSIKPLDYLPILNSSYHSLYLPQNVIQVAIYIIEPRVPFTHHVVKKIVLKVQHFGRKLTLCLISVPQCWKNTWNASLGSFLELDYREASVKPWSVDLFSWWQGSQRCSFQLLAGIRLNLWKHHLCQRKENCPVNRSTWGTFVASCCWGACVQIPQCSILLWL